MTRRADARLEPDVDRRVTFDRAVWTKPLAFAADAGDRLWALNRTSPRRGGRAAWRRTSRSRPSDVAGGGAGRCIDDGDRPSGHTSGDPRVRARLKAEGGTRRQLTSCHGRMSARRAAR